MSHLVLVKLHAYLFEKLYSTFCFQMPVKFASNVHEFSYDRENISGVTLYFVSNTIKYCILRPDNLFLLQIKILGPRTLLPWN